MVKGVKITPIFANITHRSKNTKADLVETKMSFFFFLSNIYNFSSSASFIEQLLIFSKNFSHHLLLLHYLPLVYKREMSSPLPLHLQNESSFFIIFFYFIILLWCIKWKSHISFKNPRKFLLYPLILCFIRNPWKNCYSIFSSYLILYLQTRRK